MNWITGFHAVEEALAAGRPLDRILVVKGRHGDRVEAVVRLAKSRGVPVRFEDRTHVDRAAGTREHHGVAALAAAKPAVELEDLLAGGCANVHSVGGALHIEFLGSTRGKCNARDQRANN